MWPGESEQACPDVVHPVIAVQAWQFSVVAAATMPSMLSGLVQVRAAERVPGEMVVKSSGL